MNKLRLMGFRREDKHLGNLIRLLPCKVLGLCTSLHIRAGGVPSVGEVSAWQLLEHCHRSPATAK
jgi:hypothetical protein